MVFGYPRGAKWMLKTKEVEVFVRNRDGFHVQKEMRWGLIPTACAVAPELFDGSTTHARLETVHEKPAFADCWRKKWRCLFPVQNFHQKVTGASDLFTTGKGKGEVIITRADRQPMGIAGIYNAIKTDDGLLLSAAMLTREPGPEMEKFHDREPVIIEPGDFAAWLDGSDGLDLTTPWADEAFTCERVS
jgi:putative SOS response-associated peptidase YedK